MKLAVYIVLSADGYAVGICKLIGFAFDEVFKGKVIVTSAVAVYQIVHPLFYFGEAIGRLLSRGILHGKNNLHREA